MIESDVREIIKYRMAHGSVPNARSDSARVGLVVEGGGMRGVITGAMVAALENLGLSNCFDAVYGASAGAMAAAYFVSNNASAGATIYYEEINNRKFVNLWRMLTPQSVLNLDFLIYDVFKNKVPLNIKRILESDVQLCVIATEVTKAQKTILRNFANENDLLLSLKASASNPMITGEPVTIRREKYWDAILSESIPVTSALEDGCSHLVVLRSRPRDKSRSPTGWVERNLARMIIKKHSTAAFEAYCNKYKTYGIELEKIGQLGQECLMISPSDSLNVSQIETRRNVLKMAAVDGYINTLKAFNIACNNAGPKIGHY